MAIGDIVEWCGSLGIIISFDEEGDPFLYIFKGKYRILVYKGEYKVPQVNCH